MLNYIFAIRGFALSIEGVLLAFFLGVLIAYLTNRSSKTLYRVPYMFMFALCYLGYVILSYLVNMALLKTNGSLSPFIMVLTAALPPFLLGYILMYLSVSRAYDGFGKKYVAWLLIVPLFNLGLFIVTLDDDPDDQEKPILRNPVSTPSIMNGTIGVIIATAIFAASFITGMMTITYPNQDQIPDITYGQSK